MMTFQEAMDAVRGLVARRDHLRAELQAAERELWQILDAAATKYPAYAELEALDMQSGAVGETPKWRQNAFAGQPYAEQATTVAAVGSVPREAPAEATNDAVFPEGEDVEAFIAAAEGDPHRAAQDRDAVLTYLRQRVEQLEAAVKNPAVDVARASAVRDWLNTEIAAVEAAR